MRRPGVHPAPEFAERVVGVDHRRAAGAQAVEDLALGARHLGDAAEPRQVRPLGVVHQRHGRLRQAAQVGDLAGVVHAHLDHRGAVAAVQAQQHLRQADVVVEVAGGRQHGQFRIEALGLGAGPQDGGGHLLHRGLAVAAGDADQRQFEAGPPPGAQVAERQARVGHRQRRQARLRPSAQAASTIAAAAPRAAAASTYSWPSKRSPRRAMNSSPLATVRVGGHALEARVAAQRRAAGGQGRFHQAHHVADPPRAARAAAACSTSENGRRRPAISW
jgi:hypothetical protein